VTLTAVVGLLGDDAQWTVGRGYYHHLLSLPSAEANLAELLSCYAAYAPRETVGVTRGRIDEIFASLQARARSDPKADLLLSSVENLRGVTLPRIEAAAAMEAEIAAIADPTARLAKLVDVYLGFDESYHEIVVPWAVARLMREGRGEGAAAVITALRRALPRIAGRPAAEAWRARALHAVDFFGGALTPEETADTRPDYKRYDPLSND
jgi:hypothetical protein